MLADHAQVVDGKFFICGGGWSITGPQPAPFAIVADIKVPWHGLGKKHKFRLELLDADGHGVEVEQPDGSTLPLVIEGDFQVAPSAEVRAGMEVSFMVAINSGPLPAIQPGGMYEWRLSIDGETRDEWRVTFATRPALPQAA